MKKHRSGGEYQIEVEEVSFSGILNLPTDLIHKIFSRVQVKAIARCKVVCRTWYNLLSVPDFAHYYAENTPFTTLVLSQYHEDVVPIEEGYAFSLVEISENGDDCTRTTIEPKVPGWPKRNSTLSIMGSCNGLLCLLLQDHRDDFEVVYIYNPISGESILLPEEDTFGKKNRSFVACKFGYSSSTNNFKVLKIFDDEGVERCEIFTVGVDHRWRQLEEYPLNTEFHDHMIAVNGAFCWFAWNLKSAIAAFDIGEEKYGHISTPPGLLLNSENLELAVLNHRLCLIDYSIPSRSTIWIMEEYGVAESWTKIAVLRSCFPFYARCPMVQHHPVAMSRNGNIIFALARPQGLASYSPEQKECTPVDAFDGEGFIDYISEFAPLCSLPKELQCESRLLNLV